jgi:predicted PurR-regulated permease PerM
VAYPAAKRLQRHGLKPAMAAVTVVISAILVGAGVVLITVKAIVQETAGIAHEIDRALAEMSTTSDAVGLDQQSLQRTREAIASIAAFIGRGLLTAVVGGVSAVIGFATGWCVNFHRISRTKPGRSWQPPFVRCAPIGRGEACCRQQSPWWW